MKLFLDGGRRRRLQRTGAREDDNAVVAESAPVDGDVTDGRPSVSAALVPGAFHWARAAAPPSAEQWRQFQFQRVRRPGQSAALRMAPGGGSGRPHPFLDILRHHLLLLSSLPPHHPRIQSRMVLSLSKLLLIINHHRQELYSTSAYCAVLYQFN